MAARWGVSRTVAQIHALLFISEKPLNAEHIVHVLGVARSMTFSVKVRHAEESILIGTDGRGFVDVIATRPATFRLRIAPAAASRAPADA